MRWFYVFLLALIAWGGFVQVALKDEAPGWHRWEDPR